ncbi:membrane protein [Streptomyces sulfonofaciens]|uniref:Membrane protein n=1 Tax=Streptomyces sulfonofaciens TaxID=68272 RepID=A0A919GMB4_9ACTN|nr:phosphatase PAP2 family protein [Streptomyces sulfonofaciens]GHH86551.1 membrane protein [Streptomyces sulfonofaciens]
MVLTWQVAADGPLRHLDERLGRAARGSLPGPLAELLADLGNATVAVPLLALVLVGAALRDRGRGLPRWWLAPLAAALAMAAVPAVVVPLKALVDRPGPPHSVPGGYFPSGHAATAVVAYGAAALLLLPSLRSALLRRLLLAGTAVLNAAIGAGLVVRGYHWPLDVLGSWLLCAALLAVWTHTAGRVPRGPRSGLGGTALRCDGPRLPGGLRTADRSAGGTADGPAGGPAGGSADGTAYSSAE